MDDARYQMIAPTVIGVMQNHIKRIIADDPQRKKYNIDRIEKLFDASIIRKIVEIFDECTVKAIESKQSQKTTAEVDDLALEISVLIGTLSDYQTVYEPYGYLTHLKSSLENLKRKQHLIKFFAHLHFCLEQNQIIVNMTLMNIPEDSKYQDIVAFELMTNEEWERLKTEGI